MDAVNHPKPLYIFDLDGTLADIRHRRHLVEGDKRDWPAFHAACVDDTPNMPVVRTALGLYWAGAELWVWSGRSDVVRAETERWLYLVVGPYHSELRMRKHGDYQTDVSLKRSWLHGIGPRDRARLVAVFDDRTRLVDMWRSEGVACFQVAPGDF
jgi:hypothetical protein